MQITISPLKTWPIITPSPLYINELTSQLRSCDTFAITTSFETIMIVQICNVLCFKSVVLDNSLHLALSHDQVMHRWSDKGKWEIQFTRRKVNITVKVRYRKLWKLKWSMSGSLLSISILLHWKESNIYRIIRRCAVRHIYVNTLSHHGLRWWLNYRLFYDFSFHLVIILCTN